jgi:hypothetical protein
MADPIIGNAQEAGFQRVRSLDLILSKERSRDASPVHQFGMAHFRLTHVEFQPTA